MGKLKTTSFQSDSHVTVKNERGAFLPLEISRTFTTTRVVQQNDHPFLQQCEPWGSAKNLPHPRLQPSLILGQFFCSGGLNRRSVSIHSWRLLLCWLLMQPLESLSTGDSDPGPCPRAKHMFHGKPAPRGRAPGRVVLCVLITCMQIGANKNSGQILRQTHII